MLPHNDWAKYRRSHKWAYINHGKANHCSNNPTHQAKRFEWANISKNYLEEISDWKQLCPSCHRKFDYTEETRIKQRISNKGKSPANLRRKIKQYDGNKFMKEYPSIQEAKRQTGILHTSIANCLAGRSKTAGGYKWL